MKREGPYLLAIDCSGRIGSTAVGRGEILLAEKVFSGKMRHSSELFESMETVLKESDCSLNDIDAFCFTGGPGSFTGLRIAVTTAKMLSFSRKIPLVSVNTLDTIAHNAIGYIDNERESPKYLAVVLDAKHNSFFSAVYKRDKNKWIKHIGDMLISSQQLICQLRMLGNSAVVGEGLFYHRDLFDSAGIEILPEDYWSARAGGILRIAYQKYLSGEFEEPLQLVPYYIRPPEITEKTRK
ncbi:MAG TPA: tRNA (adenosine(37)-N6)-threonylcarbamoyltransferase complex dimerization subunit type 1 TsaB [Anaerohalosphaeraceae bacterium]|nr:tRNA (adenosine(37)-N6)-threonylcarbamoyltransferase complex dimerization subunit type 1 TsaB [Anaerohalosphaeraceae bacterium]HOL90093.1 tRNA (adenosine(37)-N6)-threonylcarbamoyltransferase complex dimerization subunit type 1 TsaB [Anaerohalosphaeraceae bacterium]HPP55630.1 tRNA (adenosine(37)-N6)-threonylcarbamoyltransferase complex dimerization subunit type 1 TsaB [Anaerohalosphaeraceae bacterium]